MKIDTSRCPDEKSAITNSSTYMGYVIINKMCKLEQVQHDVNVTIHVRGAKEMTAESVPYLKT